MGSTGCSSVVRAFCCLNGGGSFGRCYLNVSFVLIYYFVLGVYHTRAVHTSRAFPLGVGSGWLEGCSGQSTEGESQDDGFERGHSVDFALCMLVFVNTGSKGDFN